MRCFFLLAMFCFNFTAFSQKHIADLFDKKKFACDTSYSQLELNICSGEKAAYADSLLNLLYSKIIRHLNKQIQLHEKKSLNKTVDSLGRKFALMEYEHYRSTKKALVSSQNQWISSRKADCALEREGCKGGTACNLFVNNRFIKMTLDRIRTLEEFGLMN